MVESDPAPVLRNGAVLVPLRGVLESLGASVSYAAADKRIDVSQGSKKVILRIGQDGAVVDTQAVTLSAAPTEIGGRAFVPLRSLGEIFGYRVEWLPPQRTVAITNDTAPVVPAEHRAALTSAGAFGVAIDFAGVAPDEVPGLLDAAQKAGAGFIKTRFDWDTLEPTKKAAFNWPIYDRIVGEARKRGLVVVGVLGNSARWASTMSVSSDISAALNSPPREKELPAWQNFVRRTVGRYKNDVHAWQIWENPSMVNFRSSARSYRITVRAGLDAARQADAQAVLFAAEPGGVNLDFIESLKRNGLTSQVGGVTLYPVSQWQPGAPAQPEEYLLPRATLRTRLWPLSPQAQEFWVGGLSRPVVTAADFSDKPAAESGPLSVIVEPAVRRELIAEFSEMAQADYLLRAATLALSSGSEKVVWDGLRDSASYETVLPMNPMLGSGLLKRDGTPRPVFNAFATLSKMLAQKQFVGALSLGPEAIALVFSDKKQTHVVAWPLRGKLTIAMNPENVDPKLPGALFLTSLPTTRILDATGKELHNTLTPFSIEKRPIWISDVGYEVLAMVREKNESGTLVVQHAEATLPAPVPASGARAAFTGDAQSEQGISWRKFAGFRGVAQRSVTLDGKTGLLAEYSRDIWNPANARPFIFLDVDDDYLFFARGVPVRVTVEVHRAGPLGDPLSPNTAGFCLEYDSPDGPKRSAWQDIEPGSGWTSYSFTLPDASLANRGGFDLLINTWGSRQDIAFGSVSVQRVDAGTVPVATAAATPVGTSAVGVSAVQ